MHALPLLLAATVAAAPQGERPPLAPENLLAGPARCVLRYLDAVRRAGPSGALPAKAEPGNPTRHQRAARALVAPRTLEEIRRRAAEGEVHPLAAAHPASQRRVLESFQLVAVRRAPRGAAIVTVVERLWEPPADGLSREVTEYLVGRVDGAWRVVDRRAGSFEDAAVEAAYAGFFDAPPGPR